MISLSDRSITTLLVVARMRGLRQLRCRIDLSQRGALAPRERASGAAPHFAGELDR